MHPAPVNPTDAGDTQQAIRTLARQIEAAVAQADVNLIKHLLFCRHHLLQNAFGPDNSVRFSDSQRAEFIRENEAWIATLYTHQHRITAEIEQLHANRNTTRILTHAYRSSPTSLARCFTHRG